MSSGAALPALVVLAAGESRRLGSCKATVELGGRSALERLLEAGAVLDELSPLVVTGAHDAEIRAAAPPGAELLHNPEWRRGRTGGILLARRARAGRDLCIAPIDAPLVPRAVFCALLEAWRAAGAPPLGWLSPLEASSGRAGHPVVAGRELLLALEEHRPDRPLRELRALARPLLAIRVSGPEILDELDTPSDLERLRARLAGDSRSTSP